MTPFLWGFLPPPPLIPKSPTPFFTPTPERKPSNVWFFKKALKGVFNLEPPLNGTPPYGWPFVPAFFEKK